MANKRTFLLTAVAVLWLVRGGWAQETGALSGEVHGNSTTTMMSGKITLSAMGSDRELVEADLHGDGTFEFRSLPLGQYRLVVSDPNGHEIYEVLVSVNQHNGLMMVQLPNRDADRGPATTVSVDQLLHPPAKKAVKAFYEARKLSEAGEHDKAAAELEKAVQMSPDFADAWTNLAAQHIRLHQYEQALQELQHASEMSKPTPLILGNMAFVLNELHREGEAVQAAREALRLDSSYAPAHYYLGFYFAKDRRTLALGIHHLELAAPSIPDAKRILDIARQGLAQSNTSH